MQWGENNAVVTAPMPPTENQVVASRAAGAALSGASIAEPRPTCDRPGFLMVLLRALSAWGT